MVGGTVNDQNLTEPTLSQAIASRAKQVVLGYRDGWVCCPQIPAFWATRHPPPPPKSASLSPALQPPSTASVAQGIGAGITRQIFYATSRFGLFEVFRDFVAQYRPTDVWSRLATGTAAGACAAFISCPAEVTLVRMSNDRSLPRAQRRGYRNIADAAVRIAREEGPATLWRGSMPFVNRAMLVGATQVWADPGGGLGGSGGCPGRSRNARFRIWNPTAARPCLGLER